jgi:hypothetical protein
VMTGSPFFRESAGRAGFLKKSNDLSAAIE